MRPEHLCENTKKTKIFMDRLITVNWGNQWPLAHSLRAFFAHPFCEFFVQQNLKSMILTYNGGATISYLPLLQMKVDEWHISSLASPQSSLLSHLLFRDMHLKESWQRVLCPLRARMSESYTKGFNSFVSDKCSDFKVNQVFVRNDFLLFGTHLFVCEQLPYATNACNEEKHLGHVFFYCKKIS